jgi:hypothetical protein
MLLRRNSTDAYILYQSLLPESLAYNRPGHSIRIVEYHRKKLFLHPTSPVL